LFTLPFSRGGRGGDCSRRTGSFALTGDEMERIGALRDRNIRVVDPEVRRPVWDFG
jgi:hypothetical protein